MPETTGRRFDWSWRRMPFALLALVVAMLALFWRPLLTDAHFYFRDAAWLSLPMRFFMFSEFSAGRFPLWLPYEGAGIPFFGQLSEGVLHPINLLYLVLPFKKAFQLNYVLGFLLGALGVYGLLRARQVRPWASAGGGLLFGACGALVSQSSLLFVIGNVSVPLVLLGLDWLYRRRDAIGLVAAGGAVALLVFSGEPQGAYAVAFFVLADAAVAESWRQRGSRLAWAAAAAVVGLLLSTIQWLPAIETYLLAARMGVMRTDHYQWSFPLMRLVELVGGSPRDYALAFNALYSRPTPWAPEIWMGPLALVLAVVGATRDRRSAATAAATLLLLWASLGPKYGLERAMSAVVPIWDSFRYPEKLVVFWSLGLAILGGQGLELLASGCRARLGRVLALILCGVSIAASIAYARSVTELWARYWEAVWLWGLVSAGALLATWGILAFDKRRRWPRARLASLLLLAVVPLMLRNTGAARYLPEEEVFAETWAGRVINEASKQQLTPPRILSATGAPVLVPELDSQVAETYVANRELLSVSYNTLFGIETILDYHPAQSAEHRRLMALDVNAMLKRVFPLLSVDFIVVGDVTYQPPKRWREFAYDKRRRIRIWQSTEKLPRAFVARSARSVADSKEAFEQLLRPDFAPGDMVAVESPVAPAHTEVRERGAATIVDWDAQRVVVRAEMAEPGLLVLNDAWAYGWMATDGERDLPVVRVNGFVRGVWLEKGEHFVEFAYRPESFPLGVAISAAAVCACALAMLVAWHRKRGASLKAAPAGASDTAPPPV